VLSEDRVLQYAVDSLTRADGLCRKVFVEKGVRGTGSVVMSCAICFST
jgi:hypothetical protein